jgi:general secretion pathway protein G
MNRPAAPSVLRHPLSAIGRDAAKPSTGFTLIELLVVIAVVAILAGLTLAAMGGIQKRGARAKAESEIQALSAAIEEYRRDLGAFPSSNTLYAELTTDGATTNTNKVYFEPPPGIVGTNGPTKFFQDPWGAAYQYTTNAAGFFEILSTAGGTNTNQYIRN